MARVDIQLQQLLTDPLAAFAQARTAGPFANAELPGMVMAVRHEAVREALTNPHLRANFPEFLRNLGVTSGPFYEWMATSPLNRDGEDHLQWRAVLSRTFTPRSVERLRPFLRQAAHELIDGLAARGECEFVAAYADAYPSLGLCELIGVPAADRDRFRGWANTIGLGFSPVSVATRIGEIDDALTHLLEYTQALAEERRRAPGDDLVSRIAQAGTEDGWTDVMIRGAIAGLVFAGHETTKNQLGWLVATLAELPAAWDAVAAGQLDVADVVEEIMRYRSAVTSLGRTVAERTVVAGETLEAGTTVIASLWSANRDAAAFPDADTFDPNAHADAPHFAFGHGVHYCLGAALARAELQESLAALTERLTCPRVLDGAAWMPPIGINGPLQLPIAFGTRQARATGTA